MGSDVPVSTPTTDPVPPGHFPMQAVHAAGVP